MYSKYQEAVDALRHEQLGRKHSEAMLEQVALAFCFYFSLHNMFEVSMLPIRANVSDNFIRLDGALGVVLMRMNLQYIHHEMELVLVAIKVR